MPLPIGVEFSHVFSRGTLRVRHLFLEYTHRTRIRGSLGAYGLYGDVSSHGSVHDWSLEDLRFFRALLYNNSGNVVGPIVRNGAVDVGAGLRGSSVGIVNPF